MLVRHRSDALEMASKPKNAVGDCHLARKSMHLARNLDLVDHIKCRASLAVVRRAQSAVNLFLFLFISHAYYRITVFLISSMLENYSISDFMHVTELQYF